MCSCRSLLSHCRRSLQVSAAAAAFMLAFGEMSSSLLSNHFVVHAAHSEVISKREPIVAYLWNLRDTDQPLISLPDYVGGNLDLFLTYSLDEFQFPLFQSLYYNERAGRYILMVLAKESSRAEFIALDPQKGLSHFVAGRLAGLQFVDQGDLKVLTTTGGTTYTFSTLADGELRCSQINDADGIVIQLKYTNDSAIETIADASGRTINFSYTDDYVSAITQTWGAKVRKLRKTWAITDRAGLPKKRNSPLLPAGFERAKHVPSNAIKPGYTAEMAAGDAMLATIFGGPGAIAAANGFEPQGLGRQYPLYRGDLISDDGTILRGHLSYAMHLYGSGDGTGETELYIPAGFTSHSKEPSPTDAALTFYYPRLGQLTNVTLAVFHVANFHFSYEGERVRIGNIGGRGGSIASYKHAHIEFYRGDTGLPRAAARVKLRIDPVTVFPQTQLTTNTRE